MRDRDIRARLRADLVAQHAGDSTTRIIDELGLLQGAARVDLAVVNGSLAAFEIKSEFDTLRRLPAQVEAYSQVFDSVVIVVAGGHVKGVRALVPPWWGISAVSEQDGQPAIEIRRKARPNPKPVPRAQAELLWRPEVVALLESRGLADGLRSKPRRELWDALVSALDPVELAREVREALRARQGWRAGPPLS